MSENPDPVIGWVLGELRKAANEGISVKELSNLLDESFIPDQDEKNATWKALTSRADVRFVDETKSPFQNLTLTDVLGVGQGDVRIRLVIQNGRQVTAVPDALVASIESDPQASVSGRRKLSIEGDPSGPSKQRNPSSQPPPKRRGRPPKAKKDVYTSTTFLAHNQSSADTPVASTSRSTRRQSQVGITSSPLSPQNQLASANTPTTSASRTTRRRSQTGVVSNSLPPHDQPSSENTPVAAKSHSTRRRSQAVIPPTANQPSTNVSGPLLSQEQIFSADTPVNYTSFKTPRPSEDVIAQEHTTCQPDAVSSDPDTIVVEPVISNPKENTPLQEREITFDSIALKATDDLLADRPAQAAPIDSASTLLPSINNTTLSNGTANEVLLAVPIAATPPQSLHPSLQAAASPDHPNRRDTTPLESSPGPPNTQDPVEPTTPTARRSSSRFSAAELLPEATFTSQADMDWEDGKDGVYVNPPGVKVKKPQGFKKKKHSTLIVFRSTKLKDPNRLANGKDTWQERIMPVVTQARLTSADDAVEQGLVPKLNKKRKADAELDPTPKKKAAKKRALAEGEVDPSLVQEWGEAYPDDDYDSDYSDISILEADVPPVPENPNSWSTSWTREGAEEARANAVYQRFGFDGRASSFTPSGSQTPYGSPSPVDFDDAMMSPMVENTPVSHTAGPQPPMAESMLSSPHDSAASPPSIQDAHAPFTPSKKNFVSLSAFTPSLAGTYRSPYAPVEPALSPSKLARNVDPRQPGDTYSEPQLSPFASFGTSATPTAIVHSSPAPEQHRSSVADPEKFPLLKLLQSSNKVSSYRSPYTGPAQSPEAGAENPFISDHQHGGTATISRQDRMKESSLPQPAAETPGNTHAAGFEESQLKGKDTARSTESSAVGTEATPGQGTDREVYTPVEISDFLSFMDRDLSTPSGDNRGGGSRGKSTIRGAVRGRGGRGGRGGTRGGRGGARGTSKAPILPPSDQLASQSPNLINYAPHAPSMDKGHTPELTQVPATSENSMFLSGTPTQEGSQQFTGNSTSALTSLRSAVLNGPYPVVPEDFFPQHALAGQNFDAVPMLDYETSGLVQPGTIPTTEAEHADDWATNDIGDGHRETSAQPAPANQDINMLETPLMTPSQTKIRGSRSTKSKAKAPPKPKPTPPPKTPRVRVDPEEKLRARIAEAEDVRVPDGATKFSCIYKELVGNMILSRDQTVLEFFALTQTPPELPMASMKVFHINGNPIMSVKGSFPMELHIKTKNEKSKKKGYRFTYPGSESAAAQNMRTKIVTAMIASEFTAGEFATVAEAQAAKVRPFLCELCGERFKNPNGLEYHLTKAKAKCNPNWDPDADTGKRVYRRRTFKGDKATSTEEAPRTPRKKKGKAVGAAREAAPEDDDLAGSSTSEDQPVLIPRSARKVTVERVFDSDGEEAPRSARPLRKPKPVEDDDVDAEGDSDDSIFNWVRNNATSGYTKTRRSTSVSEVLRPARSAKKAKKSKPIPIEDADAEGESDTSLVEWFEKHGKIDPKGPEPSKAAKAYKALHREAEVADQIIKDFADRIRRGEEEIFGLAITPTSQLTTANDIATDMTCKELNSKWYEEVVTNLVQRNEGMFPAEKSVWFASVAIWLKQHPFTTVLPESKLCAKAVDDLVESKTFTRVEFEFKDRNRNPRPITRSILTTNGLDMGTQRADLIKELVQETHPKSYVPSQLAPPPSVLDKLQAVVARLLPSLTVIADAQEDEREPSPISDFGDDSDEDDFMVDAQAADIESEESDSDKDLDDDDDPVSALSGTRPSKKRDRTLSGGIKKRPRKAGHNAKISEGVRRRFDEIRAGGENPYPWNIKKKANPLSTAERIKLNKEKRLRDQELAAAKRVCWNQAPTFMPNTKTGAWDQSPTVLQVDWMTGAKAGKPATKTKYARRQRLPEPITYMQAPNGAWSVRPFGHGVNPIYSRPARRAEGNPSLQTYLNRVENGHRPIIYPPLKNRVNLPAVPSKRLLEAMQSGKPIDEATGLPIVSRYATRKRRASSAMSPENDDEPVPKGTRRAASVRFIGVDSDEDVPNVKISRATGKPTRQYSKTFPKQVFVPNLNDPRISGAKSREVSARRAVRKPKFTEVEILNYYEPKKLASDAPRNPGLDTVPAQYGLNAPNGEVELNYSPVYENIMFIPSAFIDDDQDPGTSSWTVERLDTYLPADYCVRWDDATAFNVENLPYSDLQDDYTWIPGYGVPGYGAEEAVDLVSDPEVEAVEEPKRKRQRKNPQQTKQRKQDRDGKYSYVRQHTALAMDFVDLFEDPVAAGKYFGVEIGTPNESTLKRSRNLGSNVMLPDMESRFAVSCMVIRILTGGLDLQIDWILVAQMFPEYSLNFLKKVWNGILLRKKPAVLKLEDEFREKFLAAYQAKEIPRIDYEHLTEYPWADLVEWVMKNNDCSLNNKSIMLPPTREEVAEDFELRESKEDGCPWRETYFSITTAVYKRIMASAAVPHSIPLQPRKRRRSFEEGIDDFAVARSWVRVAAITPYEDWDRDLAKSKLGSFNKSLLSEVLDSLVAQKVVKKRATNKAKNGRIYEIHDTWSTSLRRHMKEGQFIEAVTFKRWMDAQFRSGVPCIKADYFANEGTIMCLTSLQAHGRIRFIGADIPMNKFGLGDGGYETKKIPKERLRFNIDIYPTDSYIYDDANPVLSNILFRDPPRGGENGEIPIWYGLTGKPIWRVWYRILAAVGQVVALRAGVTVQGLKESFKSTLEEWEWRLVMQWGGEVGLFDRLGEGASEGWSVGEWWWAVVGAGFADGEGEDGNGSVL